jgi:hypothetical protein
MKKLFSTAKVALIPILLIIVITCKKEGAALQPVVKHEKPRTLAAANIPVDIKNPCSEAIANDILNTYYDKTTISKIPCDLQDPSKGSTRVADIVVCTKCNTKYIWLTKLTGVNFVELDQCP